MILARMAVVILLSAASTVFAQDYPSEIRGYKVEKASISISVRNAPESKATKRGSGKEAAPDKAVDAFVKLGDPRVVRTTPFGITLELDVTIAPVKQRGRIDFLVFEDMNVNGTPVTIEEYLHPFELSTKKESRLPIPIRLFITLPRALLGAVGELASPREEWPVTGRVYIFGRFKKSFFSFKRVVPVELDLNVPSPIRSG